MDRARPLPVAAIALLSAVTALAISVWVMTAPWLTRLAAPQHVRSAEAGLTQERMVELAEQVRAFVTDADAPALPATVDGRAAFDESAIQHLLDVRNVVLLGRWATLVSAALLLIAGLYSVSVGHSTDLGAGLRWGGGSLLATLGLAFVIGVADFDAFFTMFHGLFFEPGTWTFPVDSLLILVFPISFWILAGVLLGVIASSLGVALILTGRMVVREA